MPAKFRRIDLVVACAVVVLAGAHVCPAGAITIYVNKTCGQNVWTGLDPVCAAPDGPKASIQAAIDAADTDDEIIVAQGTYYENIDFDGKQITVRSAEPENPTVIASTIIDGGGNGAVVKFAGTEWSSTLLKGLTITNSSYLTGGGGICGTGTHAAISDCTITSNSTEYDGGGLYNCDGPITNCTIADNTAVKNGGGLSTCDGPITDCTITGNSAGQWGGGLYDCDGLISGCTISGNMAPSGGGGGLTGGGGIQVTDCIIAGNSAEFMGGGASGCGLLSNCIIVNNMSSTAYGGGLRACHDGIVNCIIIGNSAAMSGGGLYDCDGTITNCIVWGNDATSAAQLDGSSVPTYSCIENWAGGDEDNIADNPLLVDFDGTDGDPATWADNDYHLQPNSPCIDTGVDAGLTEDMEGNFRPLGCSFDMGSYEYAPPGGVPFLGASPRFMRFWAAEGGGNPPDQQLLVINCGAGSLDWSVSADVGWLTVDPLTGSVPGGPETITVSVNATGMPRDDYTAKITISAAGVINSPTITYVTLAVRGAHTMTVNPDGTGDYTTIQAALDASYSGDTIIVAPGSYYENIDFLGKTLVVQSTDPTSPAIIASTIINGGHVGPVVTFAGTEPPETVLSGFTIRDGVALYGGGILGWAYSTGRTQATIVNCVIIGNSASKGGGIYGCDGAVTNCIIADNYGSGWAVMRCDGAFAHCTITHSAAPYTNVLDDCSAVFTNCIIWATGGDTSLEFHGDPIVTYSCIQGWNGGEGNISDDPQFYLGGDYHLQPTSPCIDTATDAGVTDDLDGNPRPIGGGPDMGAFEFNPSAPSIALSPGELVFVAALGGPDPDAQQLSIANCGGGTLGWSISDDADWLELDPTGGSSTGEINTAAVTVDLTGLSHGQYDATINVSAPGAVNDPRTVPVRLCVTTRLHVNLDGSGDYTSIQDAIDAAIDYDTIIVHPGTYYENIDFGGKSITLGSTDPGDPAVVDGTIIDGSASGSVVTFSGVEGPDTLLSGLTITNGFDEYAGGIDGGFYSIHTRASISNCVVTGNSSGSQVGGVRWVDGAITECTIFNNVGWCGAGGIEDCQGPISNCLITNNRSDLCSGGGVSHCNNSITNCTITGNIANVDGGGLCYCGGIISNCTVSGNQTGYGAGGGLSICHGVITDCTISQNLAADGGGLDRCNATVINCTIADNFASTMGGGVFRSGGSLIDCTIAGNGAPHGGGTYWYEGPITNCVIADNYAGFGGGVSRHDGAITNCLVIGNTSASLVGGGLDDCEGPVSNCTIAYNTALCGGGGMADCAGPVTNCIVWGNDAPVYPQMDGCALPTYSCVQGWQGSGGGNFGDDPAFADPNGPDDDPDTWVDNDYHLQRTSPCVDAGDPAFVAAPDETDIDGDPRVIGARVDMGADEVYVIPGDLDEDGDVDLDDYAAFVAAMNGPNQASGNAGADFDGDNDCDLADFAMLGANFTGSL